FVVSALGYAPFRERTSATQRSRAVLRPSGVRSVASLAPANLVVAVDDPAHRSTAMIDRGCSAIAPLGNTPGLVVPLQEATAKTTAAAILTRSCDLPDGPFAFLPKTRETDVVSPRDRSAFEAGQPSAAR
ncbi:MAG TPA: hypothetical protein VI258_15370, partial [Rhodanobacteraceae bacterium]